MTNIQKFRLVLIFLVTLGVFRISFDHIVSVATANNNAADIAWIYPLSIDGVIFISAFTLIARNGITRKARWWAHAGRSFGFIATIYANVAHSGYANTDAILINLVPAIALIITVEILIHAGAGTTKYRARKSTAQKTPSRHLKAVA